MATVVISPVNVVKFLDGGGHFWVYMQYVQGLRQLGCEVYWLERFRSSGDQTRDAAMLATFAKRMEGYGLAGKLILYVRCEQSGDSLPGDSEQSGDGGQHTYLGMTPREAEAIFRRADLLLNFDYSIDPALLACFRRTALVDIDPGLLQFWLATRQVRVSPHDVYLTTGETVGMPAARFPDCGLLWSHIRPPVCLECWPYVHDPRCEAFTTVSNWWTKEWLKYGTEYVDNNKRVSFLEFLELPRHTRQPLELAIYFGDKDEQDMRLLERHGWRVRHSREVAGTPEMYQAYIQASRGEFSCVKPSCITFQNAWISDRTLCYLASGKPVVVQHTGPSTFLPNGEGMFRFATMDEAVDALATINRDYEQQCRAARALAEAYFDAKQIVSAILNVARC
jgi:hypothetical protein